MKPDIPTFEIYMSIVMLSISSVLLFTEIFEKSTVLYQVMSSIAMAELWGIAAFFSGTCIAIGLLRDNNRLRQVGLAAAALLWLFISAANFVDFPNMLALISLWGGAFCMYAIYTVKFTDIVSDDKREQMRLKNFE